MMYILVKLCANQVWFLWCCLKSFEACSLSNHQKSQARWGQAYVLIKVIAWGTWIFKMCKPCVNQILPSANQNQPCVNFFCTICKHTTLSNSNVFCKTLWRHFLFSCAYYVPHISGSTRWNHFFGSEKVYSLYHISCGFAHRCWIYVSVNSSYKLSMLLLLVMIVPMPSLFILPCLSRMVLGTEFLLWLLYFLCLFQLVVASY